MSTVRSYAVALLGALTLAACQTSTPASKAPISPAPSGDDAALSVAEPRENDPAMNWSDPCATNLVGVVEALLFYYSQHRKMPDTLSQLPATTLDGNPLSFICPESKKPYQYYPQGFEEPQELMPTTIDASGNHNAQHLILFDAQPVHEITVHITDKSGKVQAIKQKVRYGIIKAATNPGQPIQMYVVPLTQPVLDAYLKSPQPISPRVINIQQ